MFEMRAALGGLGVETINRLDTQQAVVLLAVLGCAYRTRHVVAGAQPKTPHLGLGNVDIAHAGEVILTSQETVTALVQDLEHAGTEDLTFSVGLSFQDAVSEVLLVTQMGTEIDLRFARDHQQIFASHAFEVVNCEASLL